MRIWEHNQGLAREEEKMSKTTNVNRLEKTPEEECADCQTIEYASLKVVLKIVRKLGK